MSLLHMLFEAGSTRRAVSEEHSAHESVVIVANRANISRFIPLALAAVTLQCVGKRFPCFVFPFAVFGSQMSRKSTSGSIRPNFAHLALARSIE
jgi:hypothetical protein